MTGRSESNQTDRRYLSLTTTTGWQMHIPQAEGGELHPGTNSERTVEP